MSKEEMIEEIKKMTVVELNDLVKAIEEEFGVSAVAAAAPAAGGAAAGDAPPAGRGRQRGTSRRRSVQPRPLFR